MNRNKTFQNFFQLAQDVLSRFASNNTLMCVQNVFPTDKGEISNLNFFQFAQYVESGTQYKCAVVVDFEPYLHELLNQPRSELFQRLKSKHSLSAKRGWIAKNEASSIHGKNIVESFHVDDRHYGMNFVSQKAGENYNGIVFTNRFKNASWDVITLEIGIGLAKLLRIESEEMFNKYWSAPDWRFKEATTAKVSITIKDPKTFNSKVIKHKIVGEASMDSIVPYHGMLRHKNDHTVV